MVGMVGHIVAGDFFIDGQDDAKALLMWTKVGDPQTDQCRRLGSAGGGTETASFTIFIFMIPSSCKRLVPRGSTHLLSHYKSQEPDAEGKTAGLTIRDPYQ